MKKIQMGGKRFVLSVVMLILGFMLAYSYRLTQEAKTEQSIVADEVWQEENELRNELIKQQESNLALQQELESKQEAVREYEKKLSDQQAIYFNLAEDTEKYRMYLGKVPVKGEGVEVILEDGDYRPDEENVNNYIVHEQHVFKVVNELYIAGASAVAVNGQRLKHNSYIVCNGPVITIDGVEHPAPFIITAIGDQEVLHSALTITGGVQTQLVNDQVVFSLEKKDLVIIEPEVSNKEAVFHMDGGLNG
ncbi:MAG TPA: DUF881 domain-containing protein [Chondromyces sp.]|nr:DUF881 domain-containing protein [Chondromyces sp.]